MVTECYNFKDAWLCEGYTHGRSAWDFLIGLPSVNQPFVSTTTRSDKHLANVELVVTVVCNDNHDIE